MKKNVISSPIRWAGSKKKLLNEMLDKTFKRNKDNYIECFLGSAVVLLNVLNNKEELGYKHFYVNDINSNIINFFKILQNKPKYLIDNIKKLINNYNAINMEQKSELFYNIRKKFNNSKSSDKKMIYFFFLMKTGFNGVYRENSRGKFNVPFGKKEKVLIQDEYLFDISKLLENVEFYNLPVEDFLRVMEEKGILKNSFVYCDPPYLPDDMLVYQKQILYTKESFNHELFFKMLNDLKIKNVMISMSGSKIAYKIYNKYPYKKIDVREIVRVINPKKLFISKEIAFINYEINE